MSDLFKSRSFFIIVISINLLTLSTGEISNCENYTDDSQIKCQNCINQYTLVDDECKPCHDENCLKCSSDKEASCRICKANFVTIKGHCGVRDCSNINQCKICSSDNSQCYICKKGCEVSGTGCSCTTKVVIIIVCIIFSLVVLLITIIIFTKGNKVNRYKIVRLALDAAVVQNSMNNQNQEFPSDFTTYEEKPENISIKQEIDKKASNRSDKNRESSQKLYKISSNENNICDYCLIEIGVEKLSCGCILCERHKNIVISQEICPICKKNLM